MLSAEKEIDIRFSDTDAMGVVWHGNYLRFFEDGREQFGKKYQLEYLDVYKNGFFTPIVKSEIEHKAPLYYGEKAKVITTFVATKAAKIIFEYEIINLTNNIVSATGKTIQVFLDKNTRKLELNNPDFYNVWLEKNAIF